MLYIVFVNPFWIGFPKFSKPQTNSKMETIDTTKTNNAAYAEKIMILILGMYANFVLTISFLWEPSLWPFVTSLCITLGLVVKYFGYSIEKRKLQPKTPFLYITILGFLFIIFVSLYVSWIGTIYIYIRSPFMEFPWTSAIGTFFLFWIWKKIFYILMILITNIK